MIDAKATALETLRRVEQALRAGVERGDRWHTAYMLRQAVTLLEQTTRRAETVRLAERIAELDRLLAAAGRAPRERNRVIRERLGLGRARYYRLKRLASERDKRRF